MFLRCFTAMGYATAIICLLAMPLSLVRLTFDFRAGGHLELYLADGSVGLRHWPASGWRGELAPPRYDISAGWQSSLRAGLPGWHWWLPENPYATPRSAATSFSVPLLYMLIVALAPAAVGRARHVLFERRCRRLGVCRNCGYDLRGTTDRCPECGSPKSGASGVPANVRLVSSRQVFIALVCCLTLPVAALCAVEWHVSRAREVCTLRGLDYTWYVGQTTPRLSGAVLTPPPGALVGSIAPGTLVLLGDGEYDMSSRPEQLTDVLVIGRGAEKTRLRLRLTNPQRVRIARATVICPDDPFADVRTGTLQLTHCTVSGYNSGAGGSNAIYGERAVVLVESCVFDGVTGRAAGTSHRGTAFDMRGDNCVFVRDADFRENNDILRAAVAVFDRCQMTAAPGARALGVTIYSSPVFGRNNAAALFANTQPAPFAIATDDPPYVSAARNSTHTGDPLADRSLRLLASRGDPRYWAALLRHADPQTRMLAREQLSALGFGTALTPTIEIHSALSQISANASRAAELRLSILANGETLQAALGDAAQNGARAELREEAAHILTLLGVIPELIGEAQFSLVAREIDER